MNIDRVKFFLNVLEQQNSLIESLKKIMNLCLYTLKGIVIAHKKKVK